MGKFMLANPVSSLMTNPKIQGPEKTSQSADKHAKGPRTTSRVLHRENRGSSLEERSMSRLTWTCARKVKGLLCISQTGWEDKHEWGEEQEGRAKRKREGGRKKRRHTQEKWHAFCDWRYSDQHTGCMIRHSHILKKNKADLADMSLHNIGIGFFVILT